MAPQPITRSADHRYTYEGVTYPGVTTMLKVLDKSDALMSWAARQTAEAALNLIHAKDSPGFIDSTALIALLDSVGRKGTIRALTSRSSWQRDEAAQLGTEVHRLAESMHSDAGQYTLPTLPDGIRKRIEAYADWWNASGWTRPLTEVMGVNPSVGYGGTLDLLARDADGRLVLADIKTGKGVYREAILQLTAYGDFTVMQYPTLGQWKLAVMPKVDRYVILHVTLDGVREVELTVGQDERMAWLDCVDLYRWTQKVKGRL